MRGTNDRRSQIEGYGCEKTYIKEIVARIEFDEDYKNQVPRDIGNVRQMKEFYL